jgi:very-short-patch-repair endonuclease
VSPFNTQVALITRLVHDQIAPELKKKLNLRISTIDKFQGGEADVILFSPVIAPGAQQSVVRFLQGESRRFNVAVSRARAVCIIIGDLSAAKNSGIGHLKRLADRAMNRVSRPRPAFDSLWERRLDAAMRRRGWDPIPQYPLGTRYLDFALDPNGRKLDIEVDGRVWHTDADGNRKVADRMRDIEVTQRGWRVLRFWVHQLAGDMEKCLDDIERAVRGEN